MNVTSKLASFFRVSWRRKFLFCEAVPLLLFYSIQCKRGNDREVFREFQRIEKKEESEEGLDSSPLSDLVRDIGWAVEAGERNLPWRPVCLPRALCAHHMLRRRKISSIIHIGVKAGEEEKSFLLHAWLSCKGKVLVGKMGHRQYEEIVSYASDQ